jgi:hypothetical protein
MAGVIPEDFLTTYWQGDLFPGFCKQDPRWDIFDFQNHKGGKPRLVARTKACLQCGNTGVEVNHCPAIF